MPWPAAAPMADRPLEGIVAVVTGASGRLGPVWIAALASAGARVVGIDLTPGEDVEVGDVTDRATLEAALTRIEAAHGTPSVLVNNAGIDQPPDPAARGGETLDAFRRTVDVNLAGAFNATQVFGTAMVAASGGAIVNVGSLYATIAPEPRFYDHLPGFVKPAAYGASKAGVLHLTRYFARLWGAHGVRVNALSPGGVHAQQDPEFLAKYTARVPLGRMAEPGDLGGPLVFLASDAARYVTGHELKVDGGFTA
jgi:NAD(P)-dependent dehydrogenase (short-subunit alcohol dehydrogenase family)